jgi:hypothetical protein
LVRIGAKRASNVCAASASCTTCVRRVTCALVRHARVVLRLRIGPAAHAHRPPLRRANRGPGHRRGPCESTVSSERLPAYVPRPPARSPARSDHRSESSHRVQLRHVDLSFNQIGEDGALAIERAAALNGRSASAALVYKSVGRGNPFAIETPLPRPPLFTADPSPGQPEPNPEPPQPPLAHHYHHSHHSTTTTAGSATPSLLLVRPRTASHTQPPPHHPPRQPQGCHWQCQWVSMTR